MVVDLGQVGAARQHVKGLQQFQKRGDGKVAWQRSGRRPLTQTPAKTASARLLLPAVTMRDLLCFQAGATSDLTTARSLARQPPRSHTRSRPLAVC
jgi:hypothetical protein